MGVPHPAILSGAVGPQELVLLFLVILLLFGPRKLPEIARSIGRMMHEVRRASQDFKDQVMAIEEDPVHDGAGCVADSRAAQSEPPSVEPEPPVSTPDDDTPRT